MSRSNHRRDDILAVAARLFADRGVAATSVREIADQVGILSGSLYHYFGSKDQMVSELVLAWLDTVTEQYAEAALGDVPPREALHTLVAISLRSIETHPHAIEIYQNDAGYLRELPDGEKIEARAARVPELWMRVLEDGVARGDFRSDVPVRVFYNLLRDALWRSVTWFDPEAERSAEQLADDYVSVFLDGFAAR